MCRQRQPQFGVPARGPVHYRLAGSQRPVLCRMDNSVTRYPQCAGGRGFYVHVREPCPVHRIAAVAVTVNPRQAVMSYRGVSSPTRREILHHNGFHRAVKEVLCFCISARTR